MGKVQCDLFSLCSLANMTRHNTAQTTKSHREAWEGAGKITSHQFEFDCCNYFANTVNNSAHILGKCLINNDGREARVSFSVSTQEPCGSH